MMSYLIVLRQIALSLLVLSRGLLGEVVPLLGFLILLGIRGFLILLDIRGFLIHLGIRGFLILLGILVRPSEVLRGSLTSLGILIHLKGPLKDPLVILSLGDLPLGVCLTDLLVGFGIPWIG